MNELQTILCPPPPKNPNAIASGNFSDYIQELGDRIAALTLEESKELKDYLDDQI